MVDPLSILKTIYDLANKINELVRKNKDNQKDSDKLLEHIDRVSFIVKYLVQKLEGNTNIVKSDGHEMMSDLLKGLQKTLEHGLLDIEKACGQKEGMMGFFKASSIAKKLHEIGEDISRDMPLAMLATMACCFSEMEKMRADVKKLVNAVRARDAESISSTLPSLSKQTVEALPDLPPQVRESVQMYGNSIPYQNNDKREGNKAMIQRFKLDRRENEKGERSISKQIQLQHAQRENEKGERSISKQIQLQHAQRENEKGEKISISKQIQLQHAQRENGNGEISISKQIQLQHAQRENEKGEKISLTQQIQLLMEKNNVSEDRKESLASMFLSNGEEAAMATRQNGGHKMEARPSASSGPPSCSKTSPESAPLARTTSGMSLAQQIDMKGGPSSAMSLTAQLGSLSYLGQR